MEPVAPVFPCLRIQRRVIGALLMREVITRYGRHNIGFMWLFVEPMLFTLGVTGLWTLADLTHGRGLPVPAFALTGYSSVLLWRNAVNRCNLAITPNLALMYHRNVRVMDVFAARLLLEAAGATISLLVLASLFILIGWVAPPQDLLLMLAGWALLIWFAVSMGILVGSLSERSEVVDRIWHTITYLMFPLSGAGFLVEWLPTRMQELVLLLPMVHGTEMLRSGYFGPAIRTHYDPGYFISANLLLTLIGLALLRETGRRVEPE